MPVGRKPILEYAIENLITIGVRDIGIVMHPAQTAIEHYAGNGRRFGCDLTYIYQMEPKGIADAVRVAEKFIGQGPFVLLLGDNLFAESLSTLVRVYTEDASNAALLLAPVATPSDFGIVQTKGNRIDRIEEKPAQPKGNLAVTGAYIFDAQIFAAVQSISPSARGEYEITDAIAWMIAQKYKISSAITYGAYFDIGTPERWLQANDWMLAQQAGENVLIGNNTRLENCILKGPVIIGDHCMIRNATIGPYVAMENHCMLENCDISRSILLEKVKVSYPAQPISEQILR
jgi:glucose-1-phosphate thymidylyltransferase